MRTVSLPGLHAAQQKVTNEARRFNVLACGRRWGKSKYLTRRMVDCLIRGERYGYFGATYKLLTEVWEEAAHAVAEIGEPRKSERRIIGPNGNGVIEFWTLEDKDAGRSRRYHEVGIDEAGLVPALEEIFYQSIRPTLTDFRGAAWLAGTPKGRNFFWTGYNLGQDPQETDWASWRMPTTTNPWIDAVEVEAARKQMPDRSFRQEYLAEFIDESGGVFRGVREAVVAGCTERQPSGSVAIGVDLARTEDFTVLSAIDAEGNQIAIERFNQISWERQIGAIEAFYQRFDGATVLVDSTGVGDPIYERLVRLGMKVKGFKFSSQSKEQLIDNLAMLIEQRSVSLLDHDVQTNELLAYQYEMTAGRNIRMNAPAGMHDDCVIALALACWGMSRGTKAFFASCDF